MLCNFCINMLSIKVKEYNNLTKVKKIKRKNKSNNSD